MKNLSVVFRNACIGAAVGLSTTAVFAEGTAADAANAALATAQSDVMSTSPKVMAVVAAVVGVGILISLIRKA